MAHTLPFWLGTPHDHNFWPKIHALTPYTCIYTPNMACIFTQFGRGLRSKAIDRLVWHLISREKREFHANSKANMHSFQKLRPYFTYQQHFHRRLHTFMGDFTHLQGHLRPNSNLILSENHVSTHLIAINLFFTERQAMKKCYFHNFIRPIF